jgi:hippurate hydrolase
LPIINSIADATEEMTAWRRDFHAHPELGFDERRTSARVAELLRSWGIEVTTGIATTGLVGTLRAGTSGRSIGIRADMDALPLQELNDTPWRSTIDGVMHACGHDGHTTMLLGAAKYLAETRRFDGTVHFIFQPAEEGGGGGRVMVEEGLFERFPCDFVYGAHNDTTLPVGTIAAAPGTVSAMGGRVRIRIAGRGGHAAGPQRAIDPIVIAAQVLMALQTVISRRTGPMEQAVISICQFHAGTANNVIPDEAILSGTIRTRNDTVRDTIEKLVREVVQGTAAAHGATAEVELTRGYPSVVNDAEAARRAGDAAAAMLGEEHVVRHRPGGMGSEDFSYMAQAVPGCFVRIGQVEADRYRVGAHNPHYDFNDAILPIGASYWATLVERELARG